MKKLIQGRLTKWKYSQFKKNAGYKSKTPNYDIREVIMLYNSLQFFQKLHPVVVRFLKMDRCADLRVNRILLDSVSHSTVFT